MKRGEFLKLGAVVAAAPWFDNLLRVSDRVAALAPAETTISVGGGYFQVGDIVRVVRTGEVMQVTAISGRKMAVRRGIGSLKPSRIRRGDDLFGIGAEQEGVEMSRRGPIRGEAA